MLFDRAGTGLILPDFAFSLADQIYAMTRGEIVYEGRKSKISKAKLRNAVVV